MVNATDPTLIQLVGSSVAGVVDTVRLLVGGIFGIYILQLILRFRYERKTVKLLAKIHRDLQKLLPEKERTGVKSEASSNTKGSRVKRFIRNLKAGKSRKGKA